MNKGLVSLLLEKNTRSDYIKKKVVIIIHSECSQNHSPSIILISALAMYSEC